MAYAAPRDRPAMLAALRMERSQALAALKAKARMKAAEARKTPARPQLQQRRRATRLLATG